eukprot:7737616-Pyramimonas_sp.AAC.1
MMGRHKTGATYVAQYMCNIHCRAIGVVRATLCNRYWALYAGPGSATRSERFPQHPPRGSPSCAPLA